MNRDAELVFILFLIFLLCGICGSACLAVNCLYPRPFVARCGWFLVAVAVVAFFGMLLVGYSYGMQ